jgi:hypothetical protein
MFEQSDAAPPLSVITFTPQVGKFTSLQTHRDDRLRERGA